MNAFGYRTLVRCLNTPARRWAPLTIRQAHTADGSQRACVGIRREEHSVWERRAPLNPRHVQALVDDGVRVLVQPSTRRAYSMFEYTDVGAEASEDLSAADVIMGVKVIPVESLIPNKTYVFFSHTIKAQKENMPLLDACLKKVSGWEDNVLVDMSLSNNQKTHLHFQWGSGRLN